MITIVNYGSGNIRAIGNIYDRLKIQYRIANLPEELLEAEKLILPGVGAFDETMGMLNSSGLRQVLEDRVIGAQVPVLGICVGMQILSNGSEEGNLEGLGWIPGKVKKINKEFLPHKPKLPHLGWNSIRIMKETPLFLNVDEDEGFYFIHSYYFECEVNRDILTTTFYGSNFTSSVNRLNIFGTQFHPEKSHSNGINLLKNFALL